MKKHFILFCLVIITILSSCLEDEPTSPGQSGIENGLWTGSVIIFKVSGNYIQELKIGPVNFYGMGIQGSIESEFENRIQISNNEFNFSSSAWFIKGTFVDENSANGTYSYSGVASGVPVTSAGNWTATIHNDPPVPVILETPETLTQNEVKLQWSQNKNADFSKYEVHTSESQGFMPTTATIRKIITDRYTIGITITNFAELRNCYFKIVVVDNGNLASSSNEVTVFIPFATPTNLQALGSDSTITLTWVDNSSLETGFKIERAINSGIYLLIANVGPSITSYVDYSLPQVNVEDRLSYSVRANNDTMETATSNEVTLIFTVKLTGIFQYTGGEQVTFLPGGRLLIYCNQWGNYLFDYINQNIVNTLSPPIGRTLRMALSPTGNLLASSRYTGTVLSGYSHYVDIWDLQSISIIRTIEGYGTFVKMLVFNYDGTILATDGYKVSTVNLWDPFTGSHLREFHYPTFFSNITASPIENIIAASGEKDIIIWDANTGNTINILSGHQSSVHDVSFSPDGTKLTSVGGDGQVIIWNVSTGSEILRIDGSMGFSLDQINNIVFHPQLSIVIGATYRFGSIGVYSTTSGAMILSTSESGNPSMWNVNDIACSSDGKYLAIIASNLKLYSIGTTWETQ